MLAQGPLSLPLPKEAAALEAGALFLRRRQQKGIIDLLSLRTLGFFLFFFFFGGVGD